MKLLFFLVSGILALFTANHDNPTDTNSPKLHGLDHARGRRYCEILVVKGKPGSITATVYNTLGCNDCPDAKWKAIDQNKLKDSLKAKAIFMNGPRAFMMDFIGQTNEAPAKVTLSGLEMVERATLPVSLEMVMHGKSKPYTENTIHRSTEYIFEKGKKVFQLQNHEHTYVMQSYSMAVDTSMNEKALEHMETRLKLPEGWVYSKVTLKEDLILKTTEDGTAHVVQDNLEDTYQRVK